MDRSLNRTPSPEIALKKQRKKREREREEWRKSSTREAGRYADERGTDARENPVFWWG